MAGDLLLAVLNDAPYPATLLNGVVLRIRAERTVTRGKAAILKAYYLNNSKDEQLKEVLTVELNETTNYLPYVLGRLFSVLENVQLQVNPRINTTITDRYFNSASATAGRSVPHVDQPGAKASGKDEQRARYLFSETDFRIVRSDHADFTGTHEPFRNKARSSWDIITKRKTAISQRRKKTMSEPISNRYDFVILFDVENGNPNGDPDAGNMPRVDPETGFGLVTDVCLKRKIRNYVETVKEDSEGYRIYIKDQVPLQRSDAEALTYLGVDKDLKSAKKDDPLLDGKIRDFMCRNFYDIRTFGAVMTTFVKGALNCGQVRGPVQIGFARSVDPILPQEITITRVAITTESDAANKDTEMGRKYIVPYGLYRAEGFVSANLARKVTGFSQEDLQLLWDAILNMFENDHSAARGKMAVRELIVFQHESELGNAPSYKLFDAVHVDRVEGATVPRKYSDYTVTVDEDLPAGVICQRMVWYKKS